jgi:hypothetical protein
MVCLLTDDVDAVLIRFDHSKFLQYSTEMDSILISTARTHPAHAEGEEDRYKYISHHTHTHTKQK